MKIKTEELRKFLSVAGQIKPNPVATNLDSIKIECTGQEVVFTKTNNNIWCKYSYVCQPSPPEVHLITERILVGVAQTCNEYEIEITAHIDGVNILITSGADVLKLGIQDVKLFPVTQVATGERVKIAKELIERIKTAGKYVSTAVARTAMNFVQIGIDGIFATNGSILYYYKAFPLPELFIDHEPLNVLKHTDDLLYWTSESYDFFQQEGFTFGFIKSIVKPLPYMQIIRVTGTESFTCARQDLIDYCTIVRCSTKQEYPQATFESADATKLILKHIDADFNINAVRDIAIQASRPVQPLVFSVEWVEVLLKSLPYSNLTFTRVAEGHYKVTSPEDENYIGVIARLQDK